MILREILVKNKTIILMKISFWSLGITLALDLLAFNWGIDIYFSNNYGFKPDEDLVVELNSNLHEKPCFAWRFEFCYLSRIRTFTAHNLRSAIPSLFLKLHINVWNSTLYSTPPDVDAPVTIALYTNSFL